MVPKLILKGCPRCTLGDLSLEAIHKRSSGLAAEYQCVQCSHVTFKKVKRAGN